MIASIKSEFRKLLTIRSTLFVILASLALSIIFAFIADGYKAPAILLNDPTFLAQQATQAIAALGGIGGLVGVLLVTHEYRYNTIMYTLTAAKTRTRVLIAKFIVITVFAVLFTLFFATLAPILSYLGVHLKGAQYVHQSISYLDLLWRVLFAGWAYSILGFTLAVIIRSQVGAIVASLIAPGIVEQLLSLLLKGNSKYLPYTSVGGVLRGETAHATLAPTRSALVALTYIVIGLLVAWFLFKKRDAN